MKKLIKLLFTAVLIIPFASITTISALDNTDIITNDANGIPDKNLYNWGLENFDINKDGILTKTEIGGKDPTSQVYTHLYMDNRDIRSLKGIHYFDNGSIYNLDISDNHQLKSLEGIEKLKNIEGGLIADNCALESIEGIQKFIGLRGLILENNKLKSLPNLKELTKLYTGCPHKSLGPCTDDFGWVCFYGNSLSYKELENKLPNQLISIPGWFEAEQFQEADLCVSKAELNLSTDDLVYYKTYDKGCYNPELGGSIGIDIGLLEENGGVSFHGNQIKIESSDTSVVAVGSLLYENDERMYSPKYEFIEEFIKFHKEKMAQLQGKYTTFEERNALLMEFHKKMTGEDAFGFMWGDLNGSAIIARKAGTAYLTVKTKNQSKTIKVNVSNLTDTPVSSIPDTLVDEFYSDTNKNIDVSLTNSDTINSDIFKVAMETKKSMTYSIMDKQGKLLYSWNFKGTDIKNANSKVNLSLELNQKFVDKIKEISNQKDVMVLNFFDNGKLPGQATIRVKVDSKYENWENAYLYYYDKQLDKAIKEPSKVTIKDGYAEFTIDHCSTYFLAKEELKDNSAITVTPDINQTPEVNQTSSSEVIQTSDNLNIGGYAIGFLLSIIIIIRYSTTKRNRT